MSAGVSEQRMKGQSNQVLNAQNKNVDDDLVIPWSQQVDEASFENLSSPTDGNQTGYYESSGAGNAQFQYPPFNVKDGSWSSGAGNHSNRLNRRQSSNEHFDNDGSYNQQYGQHYNYASKNGEQHNWNSQHSRNQQNLSRRTNNYDNYCRSDRNSNQHENIKSIQRGMQNMSMDSFNDRRNNTTNVSNTSKTKPTNQTPAAPKKMTWASIASQPAKPTLRTSSTSTILKKKVSGMPPPPMVPGKHNMDIGTWDSPKSGPPLVPSPPPPVVSVPIMEPPPSNQTKSNERRYVGSGINASATNPSVQQVQKSYSNEQAQFRTQSPLRPQNTNMVRSPWIPQNNQGQSHGQQQPHYRGQGQHYLSQHEIRQHPTPHQNLPAAPPQAVSPTLSNSSSNHQILEEIKAKIYNPTELNTEKLSVARFFVIKSYSEDDIHRSIKYKIWCSTEHGNKRLDQAFRERESENGIVLLFFSVNGSGHFCGMAQMMTPVDYNSVSPVWAQDKWKGTFKVKWVYVKDLPNSQLKYIRLENNDNKSVTHSRDAQEVPNVQGQEVLRILHSYKHTTSIFDDFFHYEKRQEEEKTKKHDPVSDSGPNSIERPRNMSPHNKFNRGADFERGHEREAYQRGGGGFRERNYNRGGYHNFERRNDNHRGGSFGGSGFERIPRDNHDGPNHYRDNNEYHSNRGFYRNDYNKRDDRGFNNRDRNHFPENSGGFINRNNDSGRGGNFKDHYNRVPTKT